MTANIDQVLQKFGLTGKDRETLKKASKLVEPLLDEVLDYFYGFAESDSEIAEFFPNSSVMAHARKEQKHHWLLLLSGDFNQEFLESADRIGRVHFRIQLPFLMYLSGYSQATSQIQTLLLKKSGGLLSKLTQGQISEVLPVLTRVFALDTHFVIEAYFAAQREEQNIAFKYLKDGMDCMANKDLTSDIPSPTESDFPERYDDIRLSFNGLIDSIRGVIQTIRQTTEGLDRRAEEVNMAAQDLSRRTETQAATLEETAAAVEQINASVSSSAEATSKTNEVVTQARQNAKRGNTVVRETISKMQEIAQSSAQMSKIIGVIDDISFQTNLLALNAGVEAARAGEAGRGFAVVASEVRSLAQRAADSAQEINALIKSSTQIVDSGVALVDQAGEALDSIVKDVETASNLTNQITSSAQEQSIGLSEISTGVSQLDSVTQQNAAMVEETAGAVASMQNDTSVMAGLVREFKLSEVATPLHSPAPVAFDGWDFDATPQPLAM